MVKSPEKYRSRCGASDFHLCFPAERNGQPEARLHRRRFFSALAVANQLDLLPCAHGCAYFLNGLKCLNTAAALPRSLQANGQKIFPETL